MKKLNLSKFDLGIIIAFAVVALLGAGAWWYLSGEVQAAHDEAQAADQDFNKYSSNAKYHVVVSPSNLKILQTNIDLLKTQLGPLIQTKLQPKDNKLSSISKEDPVAWKADLDDAVQRLNAAAKLHGVTVPPNFYFGFSRYLSQSPNDEQTAVLKKQMVGIEELATILINAPVKGIQTIKRTYEEDPHTGSDGGYSMQMEPDQLGGYSYTIAGNAYTCYPLEVDFETKSDILRTVTDNLIQSPYLFVVRSLTIGNSEPNSPMLNDLERMAGPPPSSVVDTSPGEVAATTSTKGPQYLFGNSTIKVKARIDLIEWEAQLPEK